MTRRILVIEDNADLAYGLRNNLEIEGYEVRLAASGTEGLTLAQSDGADLIVLDLMLPGLDGFRVLKALRDAGDVTPVLILTARGEEADKVRGLRLGADDYMTKPFGVLELLARVEAVLRRVDGAVAAAGREVERFGDVEVHRASRTVVRAGEEIPVAPKEFDLLVALLDADGAVVSRGQLMEQVWSYQHDVTSRTVDTHVAELRRKLERQPSAPEYILTVRKAGYRLRR